MQKNRLTEFFRKPWLGTVTEIKDGSSSPALRWQGQISHRVTLLKAQLPWACEGFGSGMNYEWVFTPVLSARSGLVPVPPARHAHTHTQSKWWKMHDQVYCKTPTEDQSCRPQQRSLAPASFKCCLFEFSNMGKDQKLWKGKSTSPENSTLSRQAVLQRRGILSALCKCHGHKTSQFPRRERKLLLAKSRNN